MFSSVMTSVIFLSLSSFFLFPLPHPYTSGPVMSSSSHWNEARFLLRRLSQGDPVFCRLLPLSPKHAAVFAPPPHSSKRCMRINWVCITLPHFWGIEVRVTSFYSNEPWHHYLLPFFLNPCHRLTCEGRVHSLNHPSHQCSTPMCFVCRSVGWWHCTDSA